MSEQTTDAAQVRDFPAEGAALVVGGSGGLGAAVARMLARRGSNVAVTYRSGRGPAEQVLADVAPYSSGSLHQLDVADADAAARVVAEVVAEHGTLHTLVHAAGPHVPMVHLSRVTPAEMAQRLRERRDEYGISYITVLEPYMDAFAPVIEQLR